jgi:hypothetical protein
MAGAVWPAPLPALAQGRLLAAVMFATPVLELLHKAVQVYRDVTGKTEVQNKTDRTQDKSLLGEILDERGLVEHQNYTVILVPPGQAAIIRVTISVGGRPGDKTLGVRSAIDHASGGFQVVRA